MKFIYLLRIIALLLFVSSCEKENHPPVVNTISPISVDDISFDRIEYQQKTYSLPESVLNACDLQNYKLRQGPSKMNKEVLRKILAASVDKEKCADNLADYFEENLRKSYQDVSFSKRQFKYQPDFDDVIVGAGVHGSVVARNLAVLDDKRRVLVIDKEEHPAKHFRTYAFRLNSPSNTDDTNEFTYSSVSLKDHMAESEDGLGKFPKARQLWNHIIFNHFGSNALYSFNTEIKSIQKQDNVYIVELNEGFKLNRRIIVSNIIYTTGIGKPIVPPTLDQVWLEKERQLALNFIKDVSQPFPKILMYDELLEGAEKFAEKKRSLFEELNGKEIAVIGAGDSGKIAIEFLTGFAPKEIYDVMPYFEGPYRIDWYGQPSSSYYDFISPEKGTKSRYMYNGFQEIFSGRNVFGNPFQFEAHPQKVKNMSAADNKIKISTEENFKEYDVVILALGYDNKDDEKIENFAQVFSTNKDKKQIQLDYIVREIPATGRFSSSYETIARKFCFGSDCEQIYLVGTTLGSHFLSEKRMSEESITRNSVSIENLQILSAHFARFLLGD